MNRSEQINNPDTFMSSTMKTIDRAVIQYFKSLGLRYGEKEPAVLFTGMNRSVKHDLKTMRENGWFPAISIIRTNTNSPDPVTYNKNSGGRSIIVTVDDDNRNIRYNNDVKVKTLHRRYSYTVPKITTTLSDYTITHVCRGRNAMNESVYYSDVITPLLGTIVLITDKDTGYNYELKMPLDMPIESNFESMGNDDREVMSILNINVFGFIVDKNIIKRQIHPATVSFNEG